VSVLYDSGLLIAAEGNDREVWADHRARLEFGVVPRTTAPVVAQVSRSPRQVQLRRLLRGCDVVEFVANDAHEVGELLARARSSDVVDAHAVVAASRSGSKVMTSDEEDLRRLASCLPEPVVVQRVGAARNRRDR